ncbi:MAG TPA: aminotransferase class V-fold PLP-dependent enzyme [Gaiellales bacterium]|nr:aminotransferase class V-fold PLP-dependent enzyme [Gaiellales bacterium]
MASSTSSDLPPRRLALDAPRERVLEQACRLIAEAWRGFDHARPGQPAVDRRVRRLLGSALPDAPTAVAEVIADAALVLDESIAQPRPRYFAFVASSGLEVGVIADALAACFDANLAVWAGAATEVEAQAVRWTGELVGYPAGGGTFTSGGTISNLTALAAARERALPGCRRDGLGGRRAAVYCSADAHYSVDRAVELLGLGGRSVRVVAVDERRRMRPAPLAEAIDRDLRAGIVPVAVVATAGTTLTGAVDPIAEIADVCSERAVWLHVDGAYGLPAAAVASMRPAFAGLERADSVSLDAHKWLYLPKACGVVLVRDRADLLAAFAHDEGYLPHDRSLEHAVDATLEYSRPFRALKLWMALRAHGADAFREAIEANLGQARQLCELIDRSPELERLDDPQLSIVPYRHVPAGVADLDDHNRRLALALQEDARVYVAPARVDGRVYLRPCFVNYRTRAGDVRALVDVTLELGRAISRLAG